MHEPNLYFRPNLLADTRALITGGGSGICKGIAQTFLALGARVTIMGRNQSTLDDALESFGPSLHQNAFGFAGDVRDAAQVDAVLESAMESMGGLNCVINGAAGNFLSPAAKLSPKGFKTVMEIDAHGTYNVSHLAYKKALSRHGGSILNLSATLQYAGTPYQVHAGSAKAAIDAMTRHLAVEWGPEQIRVNAIAPGPIDNTVGMEKLAPGGMKKTIEGSIPLGRFGRIGEIANAAVFLTSAAAAYITGAVLVVDGGAWMTFGNVYQTAFKANDNTTSKGDTD
ncbi:MAG: SDR family oxidoreductase [Myxococcota bacterium]|nr:SDR family oxidoreductase [Myxococcota bacterium]